MKNWPKVIQALFPAMLIYYKPNKSRDRRRKVGVKTNGKINPITGKEKLSWVYKAPKRLGCRKQNDYCFIATFCLSPDGWGTVSRSLKHKGYKQLIGLVWATDEEISIIKNDWRYRFFKFKTASELFNWRKLDNEEWRQLCERIEQLYPSHASGQLRLL